MSHLLPVPMVLAGIILKSPDRTLDVVHLYKLFCIEFRKHSTEHYTTSEICNVLANNNWFLLNFDPYFISALKVRCEVKLTNDLRVLDAMRFQFEKNFWSCSDNIERDTVFFLCKAKCTLAELTVSLRLPQFDDNAGFGFLLNRDTNSVKLQINDFQPSLSF